MNFFGMHTTTYAVHPIVENKAELYRAREITVNRIGYYLADNSHFEDDTS
jgi:hypothetical protein